MGRLVVIIGRDMRGGNLMIAKILRKPAKGEEGKDGKENTRDEDEDDAPIAAEVGGE